MVDFVGTAGALQVPARQLNSSTLIVETPGKFLGGLLNQLMT